MSNTNNKANQELLIDQCIEDLKSNVNTDADLLNCLIQTILKTDAKDTAITDALEKIKTIAKERIKGNDDASTD